MLRLCLIGAVMAVSSMAQHAAIPPIPMYPVGHPGRAAHDAVNAQQNNPLYNAHHAEYFRSIGQAYNPGAAPATQQQQQPAYQQPAYQQPAAHHHAAAHQQPAHSVHPPQPALPTYAPGHPAHALHAHLLSQPHPPGPQQNQGQQSYQGQSYQGQNIVAPSDGTYNPQFNTQGHWSPNKWGAVPYSSNSAPAAPQYQAPAPQYQAPAQHYQAPAPQYQQPSYNHAPVSNHLQLSYDIGVGQRRSN